MPAQSRQATARLIHKALIAGIMMLTVVLAVLPTSVAVEARLQVLLVYLAFGFGAVGCTASLILASRLPREALRAAEPWWDAHFGEVMTIWVLLDGPAAFGAVAHFLSGSPLPLVVTAVALLLFVLQAPQRLRGG
jgi:hypothetical protein